MPPQAEAGIAITANNWYNINGAGAPIRTLFIQNLTTGGQDLVFFMSENPSKDRFVLRPGQFKYIPFEETSFRDAPGLWCTKIVRVQPAVAGQVITAFDYDLTTWDHDAMGKRY